MLNKKMLIVDDNIPHLKTLKDILKIEFPDYEIFEGTTGEEAIEIAKKYELLMIFLDVKLPGISGFEAAKEIKKINPVVPIVFISGHCTNKEHLSEASELRACDYIIKPVDIQELKIKVGIYERLYVQRKQLEKLKYSKVNGVDNKVEECDLYERHKNEKT